MSLTILSSRFAQILEKLALFLPEKAVVLHANLPQPLGRAVVVQLEPDRGFKLFEFARPEFDKEAISFIRDLDDFGPSESVDPEPVPVDRVTRF